MSDVTASMGLDMSDVAKALAKMPQMTSEEAEKAVRALTKTFDRAASEARRLRTEVEKSSKAAGHSIKQIGQTAGDAESSMRALSGAVGMISPEAAAAMNAVAELGGAVEGLGRGQGVLAQMGVSMSSLGPIALAAAAAAASLGMAWLVLADNAERAEEKVARAAKAAGMVGAAHVQLEKVVKSVDQTWQKTLGTYDAIAAAQEDRDAAIRSAAQAEREAAAAVVEAAQANIAAASGTEERVAALAGLTQAEMQRDRLLQGAAAREEEALLKSAQTAEYLREQGEEEDRLRRATEARAAATAAGAQQARQEAQTAREAAEALRIQAEAEAALQAQVQGRKEAAAIVASYTEHRLSEIERIDAAEQEAMARLLETGQATQEQQYTIAKEFTQRRMELAEEELAAQKKWARKAAETAKQAQQAFTEAVVARAEVATGVMLSLADSVVAAMQAQGDASREAMAVAFAAQKVMAISDIAVKAAQGVMAVWAVWAANPPVAMALSAGVALTAGIQSGLVLAEEPTFHVGGMMAAAAGGVATSSRAPDEVSARLLSGEPVLNRKAGELLGERGVNELNAGRMPSGSTTVEFRFKHKLLDAITAENVLMPTSPLRRAMKGRSRVGHRSR